MKSLLDKKRLLVISFLLSLTVLLNALIFLNQLNYGFRDVDWQVLYYFKLFGNISINHFLQEIKVLGVYISESYYVGLLEQFFGLNFVNLHQATHLLKIISTISVYILILKIFKNKLLAFISSLIYTISYTHAGTLFQLSSGGYFLAFIFMNSFLTVYYYTLIRENILKWSIPASILLILTLALKPERMYPLIFLVFLVEFFMIALGKFKTKLILISLKRMLLVFAPLIILIPFYPSLFTEGVPTGFAPNQFSLGISIKIKSILNGNLQLLLEPFASLGSIFLYQDYWKLFGHLNFESLAAYILSLTFGPILKLSLVTFSILLLIDRKPFKLEVLTMTLVFIFGLIIYALNINWHNMDTSIRLHFDPNIIAMPSLLGFYVVILSFIFFLKWLKSRNSLLFAPILGITFAFLFILMTWISADVLLIFMGPQRYLSIPSIGTSLFLSGLLLIAYEKLRQIKFTKQFSWAIFLFLIPLLIINYHVTNNFFDMELISAGVKGSDQTRAKNKLLSLLGEINTQDKSLFYFDETQDQNNAYFNEGTVLAGFEYWMRFNKDGTLNNLPEPGMIRTTRQCPEHTHLSCLKVLKQGISIEGGEKGIWYSDTIRGNIPRFYKLSNFYAFRFINKDIVDIRAEVLKELNL